MHDLVAVLHVLATVFMTGVIWFVQVVHYPLFARVGAPGFGAYEAAHQRRTGWVVGPAMLVELETAVAMVVMPAFAGVRALAAAGFALVVVVWLSTMLLQVPCHLRLARAFDARVARRLVATNWIRTVAWTVRSGLALAILHATWAPI